MKLSKLFKESRLVKATKDNLKIGDYVYYDRSYNDRRYCKVTKIDINKSNSFQVWGKWTNDKYLKSGFDGYDARTTAQVYIIR